MCARVFVTFSTDFFFHHHPPLIPIYALGPCIFFWSMCLAGLLDVIGISLLAVSMYSSLRLLLYLVVLASCKSLSGLSIGLSHENFFFASRAFKHSTRLGLTRSFVCRSVRSDLTDLPTSLYSASFSVSLSCCLFSIRFFLQWSVIAVSLLIRCCRRNVL